MIKQAILLLSIVSSCMALTCYHCRPGEGKQPKNNPMIRNCGKDTNYKNTQVCPEGTQYCFKDSYRGNVTLGCATDKPQGQGVCLSRKVSGKVLRINRCWCKGNKCNEASSFTASFAILAIISIKAVLSANAL